MSHLNVSNQNTGVNSKFNSQLYPSTHAPNTLAEAYHLMVMKVANECIYYYINNHSSESKCHSPLSTSFSSFKLRSLPISAGLKAVCSFPSHTLSLPIMTTSIPSSSPSILLKRPLPLSLMASTCTDSKSKWTLSIRLTRTQWSLGYGIPLLSFMPSSRFWMSNRTKSNLGKDSFWNCWLRITISWKAATTSRMGPNTKCLWNITSANPSLWEAKSAFSSMAKMSILINFSS